MRHNRQRAFFSKEAGLLQLAVILAWGYCWTTVQSSLGAPFLTLRIDTPRRAFYRGEEIPLVVHCTNEGDRETRNALLQMSLGKVRIVQASLTKIPKYATKVTGCRVPTWDLRAQEYSLSIKATSQGTIIGQLTDKVTLVREPNPNRLLVWLWGGGGDKWYLDHGFTSWSGPSWKSPAAMGPILDEGLLRGGAVVIHPNGGLRDIEPGSLEDPDALNLGVLEGRDIRLPNPLHREVAKVQDEANRKLMEHVRIYPQIRTAFFNTEVVDVLKRNRNRMGDLLIQENLGFTEEEIGEPVFVKSGVIADNDRAYLYHKFLYQRGNGLSVANQRTVDMIHRFRPDILTISDPYRETSLYDLFPNLDVIETWTYTNPDPKLMLYVETLRAACKPTAQEFINTVTLLNYPGELAPTEEWMLMGPGRVKVASWINLSRAPTILGYYYSSACNPVATDNLRVPYSTSLAIRELSEKVFKPYGPMLTRLTVAPRRIGVLSSTAARVHGSSPRLRGGYANMQPYHFYTILAMAHLQADVLFDETIQRYGLGDYDVLVLPKCDILTESVYHAILAFKDRGGVVIADQYLGPDIPGAIRLYFDFTYRTKVNANAISKNQTYAEWNDQLQPDSAELKKVEGVTAQDDQTILESYASALGKRLRGIVEPEVECDSPTVLLNMLESGSAKYLVLINDKRTYDDRVGKYKGVLGKLLPQKVTIKIKQWSGSEGVAYDMLERKRLKVAQQGEELQFDIDLTTLGGKIVALYPKRLAHMTIRTPAAMIRGSQQGLTVLFSDVEGALPPGLQPLDVRITDPQGRKNETGDYYCAVNGVLSLSFTPAVNDVAGEWTIAVRDLTAGLQAKETFQVQ